MLPTYWSTSFAICLGTKFDGVTRFLQLGQEAVPLYALIADGQYHATSLDWDAWNRLIVLMPLCSNDVFKKGSIHM
ncbi:unnamed protein product [Pocillopora meandrina]|uniref:Uncharacterized protein n=1 Tax=Pocillopora meandrina TaxID=46732 RepID=A0AAU9X4S5_9CNID|nr:unnamed protein product [Pocillopora meandrina]